MSGLRKRRERKIRAVDDKMSQLPEGILHEILSYLPIRDAARTSVLSKWWNNAWETLPYLNFIDESFLSRKDDPFDQFYQVSIIRDPQYWVQFEKNRNLLAVAKTIVRSRQQINIEKLRLLVPPWNIYELMKIQYRCYPLREMSYSSFGVIIGYVATLFLKELKLVNAVTHHVDVYLPPSLLSAKRLTVVSLKGFNLSSSWSSLDIKFTCLQKLTLVRVFLDDKIMENLILGSRSSLETLKLKYCHGLKTIRLGGEFVKLKRLKVCEKSSMEVLEVCDALELEDLHVSGYTQKSFYFNVTNCPFLRKIFLHFNKITENNLHQLLASCSEHVEELNIWYLDLLKNITISSDSLKILSLHSSNLILRKVNIFSPSLKSLTFNLDKVPDFFFLNGGLINQVLRVKLILSQFDHKWAKFLSNFRHIKTVTVLYKQLVIIPNYWRKELLSPLYGTRDISFKLNSYGDGINEKMIAEYVKYLLWLAPRAERLSMVLFSDTASLSLELVYDDEDDDNDEQKKIFNCSYCKLLPIDCWRHCLKEVRIHKFEKSIHDLKVLKDFFFKEVKNLKIVDYVSDTISQNED